MIPRLGDIVWFIAPGGVVNYPGVEPLSLLAALVTGSEHAEKGILDLVVFPRYSPPVRELGVHRAEGPLDSGCWMMPPERVKFIEIVKETESGA